MRNKLLLCSLLWAVVSWGCSSGPSTQEKAAPPAGNPAPEKPAASAEVKEPKWKVGHQLVQGQPWGSETKSEAELLQEVKEEESTGDQRLVLALDDLAAWYRGQKRLDEAATVYKRVLKIQQDRMGANHYDTALSHNDLGVVHTEAGKLPEAEQEFKAALELWDKSWDMPLKTEDNAVTFHNYSVLLEKMGRGAEAKQMEDKGDEIMKAREAAVNSLGNPK